MPWGYELAPTDSAEQYASTRAIPPSRPQSPDSDDTHTPEFSERRYHIPTRIHPYGNHNTTTLAYAIQRTCPPYTTVPAPLAPTPARSGLHLGIATHDGDTKATCGITDEGEKIEALQDYIWYDTLTTSQLASWAELSKAFNERWEPLPRAEKRQRALKLEEKERVCKVASFSFTCILSHSNINTTGVILECVKYGKKEVVLLM
ncbi:hypothetical protein EV401DRAFT_2014327 [Pisolithus croceorrhizus]|nr:hypothetical protein EV401DRAFT_2014327 [Pisolithus croceorrhizus]